MSVTAATRPSLLQLAHYTWYSGVYRNFTYRILNSCEDTDINSFFKSKRESRSRGHKAAAVKDSVG